MRKVIIGVMGPGEADELVLSHAHRLGTLIAEHNWILLTGGRRAGVMHAASRGAHEAGGLVLGILPDDDGASASEYVDIAILTGMGSARNNINVLSSDVVIACGMGSGTASEVALALKAGKSVILLTELDQAKRFFIELKPGSVIVARSPEEAITSTKQLLGKQFAEKRVQ